MAWHPIFPLGSVSVRANKAIGQDNTTYIQATMGNTVAGTDTSTTRDHFWNVDASLDGRHRFIQSPKFQISTLDADPIMGDDMDACMFFRNVNADVGRVEGFYKTANAATGNYPNRYQFIPSFMSGTINVTSSFTDMVTLPKNVYGEIYMFRNNASGSIGVQAGSFSTSNSNVAVSSYVQTAPSGSSLINLIFENSGLKIQVKTKDASSGNNWEYRVTYRAK
jgi:hypothetical protein